MSVSEHGRQMRGAAAVVVIVTGIGAIVVVVVVNVIGRCDVGVVVSTSQHSPRAVLLRRLRPCIAQVWGRVV